MSKFSGKRVVITGAGRGIGLAIAHAFAREGAKLAIMLRRRKSMLPILTQLASTPSMSPTTILSKKLEKRSSRT